MVKAHDPQMELADEILTGALTIKGCLDDLTIDARQQAFEMAGKAYGYLPIKSAITVNVSDGEGVPTIEAPEIRALPARAGGDGGGKRKDKTELRLVWARKKGKFDVKDFAKEFSLSSSGARLWLEAQKGKGLFKKDPNGEYSAK